MLSYKIAIFKVFKEKVKLFRMSEVIRLYQNFKPTNYILTLEPNKESLTFTGTVIINGLLSKNQKELLLHAKELNVTSVLVNKISCQFKLIEDNDLLCINLPKLVNTEISVEIEFNGNITKPMHGLYPCYGRDNELTLATQFESHHAREVFPCIDEPEAKAIFSLSLTTDKGDIVLANTEPKNTAVKSNKILTVFEDTPKMSTYLLAFVIGDLKKMESKTKNGTLVRAWATPDQADNVDFALKVAVHSLEFFTDYFKIDYPLSKCDVVALPDFAAGAMENWGLLTFRETCMLVDPNNTSLDAKQFVAMTVAHEVAHQWFGNLVTMEWWDDLWLNEGFASWIEYMCVDNMFPDWHMWTQFTSLEQQSALRLDVLKNTHPIEATINNPEEINAVFDNISYSKGACVIHMLHEYLGKDDFREGLVHYLKKHSYGSAVTSDLWQALHEVSHKQVSSFMSTWTAQPGYPIVRLSVKHDLLHISQKRFLTKGVSDSQKSKWSIPLLSSHLKETTLNKHFVDIKMPSELDDFKINQGQSGFYITKYWPEQYKRLGRLIDDGKMGETDRVGLLSDMLAMSRNGYLPVMELISMLEHYKDESSAVVWDIIAMCIGDIRHVMGNKVQEAIKPFIRELTAKQVDRLGWDEIADESYFDKMLRPTVLGMAAVADRQSVVDKATALFTKANDIEDIPSDLRSLILSTVAKHGGKKEFDKMLIWLNELSAPENMVVLAHSMTNFRNNTEIKRALNLIRSENVRLQDSRYWIVYSMANPSARIQTWHWVKSNWKWLKDTTGNDVGFTTLPIQVARAFSNRSFLEPYKAFFKKVYEPSLDRSIKQGLETIKMQATWHERDEKELRNWLLKNYS